MGETEAQLRAEVARWKERAEQAEAKLARLRELAAARKLVGRNALLYILDGGELGGEEA